MNRLQRKRIAFDLAVYFHILNRVKPAYVILLAILLVLSIAWLTIFGALEPLRISEIVTMFATRQHDPKLRINHLTNKLVTADSDTLYAIDLTRNTLIVSRLQGRKLNKLAEIPFGEKKALSTFKTGGTKQLSALYLCEDKPGVRNEYVYFPKSQKEFLLYSYNPDTSSYNLGNEGIVVISYQNMIVYKDFLYFMVLRMDFDKVTPDRGLWKLDMNSGKVQQITPTAAFSDVLKLSHYQGRAILHGYFAANSNGAKYLDTSDDNGYVYAWDLDRDSLMWKNEYHQMNYIYPTENSFYQGKQPDSTLCFSLRPRWFYDISGNELVCVNAITGKEISSQPLKNKYYSKNLVPNPEPNPKIMLYYPIMILEDSFAARFQKRFFADIQAIENLMHNPGFRLDNKLVLPVSYRNKSRYDLLLCDTQGSCYAQIKEKYINPLYGKDPMGGYNLAISPVKDKWILHVDIITLRQNTGRSFLMEKRACFGILFRIYNLSLILQKNRVIVLVGCFLVFVFLCGLLVLLTHKPQQAMRDLSRFLTSPSLVFLEKSAIDEQLKPKIENSAILVIRIANLRQVLSHCRNLREESAMINDILKILADCCFKEEIIIDKYLNEGIMLIQRGDLRERMINRFLEVCGEVNKTLGKLKIPNHRRKLQVCYGLAYGENLVGLFGNDTRKDFTAMGKYVNLAFRLVMEAKPNQILTNPEALEGLQLTNLGEIRLSLKGFAPNSPYCVVEL